MKNVFKILGIIALAAVIGFSMVSCGGDDDGGGGGGLPAQYRGTWKEQQWNSDTRTYSEKPGGVTLVITANTIKGSGAERSFTYMYSTMYGNLLWLDDNTAIKVSMGDWENPDILNLSYDSGSPFADIPRGSYKK